MDLDSCLATKVVCIIEYLFFKSLVIKNKHILYICVVKLNLTGIQITSTLHLVICS